MYHFKPELFNPQQRQAVLHGEGPILVLAGAGSGKTRIIAHRVAYLVDQCHIDPAAIVAVSFTNKAAKELKTRIAELIGAPRANFCQLSTFHALGANILRANINRLGWKLPFAIIDGDDQRGIVKNVLKDLHLEGSAYDPEKLISFISRVKSAHLKVQDMPGMRWNPQGRTLCKIFDQYQVIRKSMNAVDFDDLIALTVELFEAYQDVLFRYQEAWQYLLVDEYQDTNALQFRLLELLCQKRANIMVVGDDDQSIYAFRGADSEHILDFPKHFKDVVVVSLEQNYRSSPIILEAANAVISKNKKRHAKRLWTEAKSSQRIVTIDCSTPEEEASTVIEQILSLRTTQNLEYSDFAILYRTNPQSRVLEEACIRLNVPYRVVGGTKFFDNAEIRDLVFYLRAIYAFHDELALRRIINTPRRGIAAAALSRIDERSKQEEISFFEAIKLEVEGTELPAAARHKLAAFLELLERYHKRVFTKAEPLSVFLEAFIHDLHFLAYIQSSSSSDKHAQRRRENVDELINAIAQFERQSGRDLLGFLQQISLDPPQNDENTSDVISLMTLHASKGLEFPAVTIVGCEENYLPHANSLEEPALSEERRLFYVGITRAKTWLCLTRCLTRQKRYENVDVEASRFIDDIPPNLLDKDQTFAKVVQEQQEAIVQERFAQMQALFSKGPP